MRSDGAGASSSPARGREVGSEGRGSESSLRLQLGLAVGAVKVWTTASRLVPAVTPGSASIGGELPRRPSAVRWRLGGYGGEC